jgi:hypothetical protein
MPSGIVHDLWDDASPVGCRIGRILSFGERHLAREQVGVEHQPNSSCPACLRLFLRFANGENPVLNRRSGFGKIVLKAPILLENDANWHFAACRKNSLSRLLAYSGAG